MSPAAEHSNIGFDLGITIRRWRARMDERLAPLGLTQARWLPLRHLSRAGGRLPQRKLAELLGIEGPSVVRILDELERLGLIERQSCDVDRRAKTICLTERAKPLIAQITELAEQLREEILGGIAASDMAVFRQVLAQISNNLENLAR